MSLFNELLKSTQNATYNMIKNNLGLNVPNGKEQKLRSQLHTCTYTDDTKFIIQKAVKQVFHVYPYFDTDVLSFKQSNVQKRYIELKAILEVQVRGKICKVDYNMMIPAGFPKKAPYVRIINRNPDFIVDDFYKPLQSPNDPKSYILNERLNEVKYWDQTKSIVNVIIESCDLLRNKFPFSKPGSKSNMPSNSPWSQLNSNQSNFNQNQGFPGMYGNNQGLNNYANGNGYSPNNYNMGQMGGFNNFNPNNKPPIPFNSNNMNQIIANGQKFSGESKKVLEKLKAEHTKALESVQALDILRYSIQSEQNFLRKENVEMNNFLSANEDNQSTQNLVNLVRPQDELSQQILDLLSGIKSWDDCTNELEKKFNEGAITFQDFLKNMRKIQETKFQEKVLLSKCISVSQKY